jgi:DNA-directed RNA polymerase alpha subunit
LSLFSESGGTIEGKKQVERAAELALDALHKTEDCDPTVEGVIRIMKRDHEIPEDMSALALSTLADRQQS